MKMYVTTAYSDDSGEHAVGDEVDFPNKTPQEKLAFDRLVRYGIIGYDRPESSQGEAAESEAKVPAPATKGRARRRS